MPARSITLISVISLTALTSSVAEAGVITVGVDGINDAAWQWDVPFLNPGDVWSRTFDATSNDQSAFVTGYIEAGVSANGRQAWLNVTDFEMGASRAMELGFVFNANIDFGTLFSGWANPTQFFDADQALNSHNARITWSKGANWDGKVLPPLAGFFELDDLQSRLSDNSGRFDFFTSPINLRSETRVTLLSGGLGDAVLLPDSAYDFFEIPSPGTIFVLAGVIAAKRRR